MTSAASKRELPRRLPTPLPPVSDGQLRLLQAFLDYYLQNRCCPTFAEAAGMAGLSGSVSGLVAALVTKGYLSRTEQTTRNYELTPKAMEKLEMEAKRKG